MKPEFIKRTGATPIPWYEQAMYVAVFVLAFMIGSWKSPEPVVKVDFYKGGKVVKTFFTKSWISWQMKEGQKFNFPGNLPFDADSVSVKLLSPQGVKFSQGKDPA